MNRMMVIILLLLSAGCAGKKDEPQSKMPQTHNGECSAAKQTINCLWQQVPDNNLH